MNSVLLPLVWLTLAAAEEGFTEPLADEKSPPEYGYKLTKDEALAGWIALFDGATPFGWKEARVEAGERSLLVGGQSTSSFATGKLRLDVARAGELVIGDKRHELQPGKMVLGISGPPTPLRCSEGLMLAQIDFLPASLESIYDGTNFADWQALAHPGAPGKRADWKVEKGVILARGGPVALEYRPGGKEFLAGDFLMQVEARTRAPHTNGGVFLRNQPGTVMMGYEAQIHHRVYETRKGEGGCCTGSIDDRQHARRLVARDRELFRMTAVLSGSHIALWINGQQTADWTDDRPAHDNPRRGQRVSPGTLQLQAHDPETDLEFHRIFLQKWQ